MQYISAVSKTLFSNKGHLRKEQKENDHLKYCWGQVLEMNKERLRLEKELHVAYFGVKNGLLYYSCNHDGEACNLLRSQSLSLASIMPRPFPYGMQHQGNGERDWSFSSAKLPFLKTCSQTKHQRAALTLRLPHWLCTRNAGKNGESVYNRPAQPKEFKPDGWVQLQLGRNWPDAQGKRLAKSPTVLGPALSWKYAEADSS